MQIHMYTRPAAGFLPSATPWEVFPWAVPHPWAFGLRPFFMIPDSVAVNVLAVFLQHMGKSVCRMDS